MGELRPITERLEDPDAACESGKKKMEWARQYMPIHNELREEFLATQPFDGERIATAKHIEAKSACFIELLADGGAEIAVAACNPLSAHDDVSVALDAHERITSYAKQGASADEFTNGLDSALDIEPTLLIDDGGELIAHVHRHRPELLDAVVGGCEQTTTGVDRLRAMDADGVLEFPAFAINDTPMKRLFDNVHGTGESTLSNISMTTNLSWAGKTVVVAGYGDCGRGVAKKAAGQNAEVVVTEVEPRRALEAHMEGYDVMPMAEAAELGDVFVTVTGNRRVIRREHFEVMPDGALLANAGHFDVEIDIDALAELAVDAYEARDGVRAYELDDGRRLNLLAEGRLVNLASPISYGHPVEIIDQTLAMDALCARELVENGDAYDAGVHDVPDELDRDVARVKLEAEGVEFDSMTADQHKYANSWQHGT